MNNEDQRNFNIQKKIQLDEQDNIEYARRISQDFPEYILKSRDSVMVKKPYGVGDYLHAIVKFKKTCEEFQNEFDIHVNELKELIQKQSMYQNRKNQNREYLNKKIEKYPFLRNEYFWEENYSNEFKRQVNQKIEEVLHENNNWNGE